MVQVLPAYQKQQKPGRPSYFEMLQLDKLLSGAGQGFADRLMKRDEEKRLKEQEEMQVRALQGLTGMDLSGIQDPKIRLEAVKQGLQLKNAPEKYKAKFDALQKSPIGKYLQGSQSDQFDQNQGQRSDMVNDQGEIELGNIRVPSMIPEEAIFNAEAVGEHGLAQQFREHNKSIQEESRHREKQQEKRELHKENLDYQSFKDNKDYIEKVVNGYEGYKRDRMVLDAMSNLSNKGNLPTPLLAKSLEKLGMPLGILQNPDAEQFEKLSQELMKNIQGTYGSRILQSEVQSFMRSIPTLMNSPEGQKRLIQQWNLLNEGKKIYYDAYKQVKKENPERLPRDLHEQVLDRAEGALEKMSNRFRNLSQVPTDYVKSPGKVLVVDPYGEVGEIEAGSLEEALKEGYEFLE